MKYGILVNFPGIKGKNLEASAHCKVYEKIKNFKKKINMALYMKNISLNS